MTAPAYVGVITNSATAATSVTGSGTTVAGELLVAFHHTRGGTNATVGAPAGWTAVPSGSYTSGTTFNHKAWYKTAVGGSESHAFTTSTSQNQTIVIVRISGVNATPIDTALTDSTGSTVTTFTVGPLTTLNADDLLVSAFGGSGDVTIGDDAAWTRRGTVASSAFTGGSQQAALTRAAATITGYSITETQTVAHQFGGLIVAVRGIATAVSAVASVSKTVTLSSAGTTGAVSYAWTQISGPTVTISNAATATATFTLPSPLTAPIVIRLTATNGGVNATQDVTISPDGSASRLSLIGGAWV